MSLKKQLINYFLLNQDAGVDILHFEEALLPSKPKNKSNVSVKKTQQQFPKALLQSSVTPEISTDNKQAKLEVIPQNPFIIEPPVTIIDIPTTSVATNHEKLKEIRVALSNINNLANLNSYVNKCQACVLSLTRTNLVFGTGNSQADIMIIGEAPGADEDTQGEPFVGRAGKLLTDILKAINIAREDVYIANICKCRPPNNRRPTSDETTTCELYLSKQIEIIRPKFILALGLTAAETLFKKTYKMADIRGNLLQYNNIKTLVTYHPAALLRNPSWKKSVWEDVQMLRALYDQYLSGS